MTSRRSIAVLLTTASLGATTTGCGTKHQDQPSATTTAAGAPAAPAPPTIPNIPTATFVFDAHALKPPTLLVPRTKSLRLVLISADGLPHAATVTVGHERRRLVIAPDARGELQLTGLRSGHRYHVVPAGATEPVTIRVG